MKVITVGRDTGNDIVINDSFVGRRHLEMEQDDSGNILITDLDSKNGTFVNGRKLTGGKGIYLSPTDIVKIGNTPLTWKNYFAQADTTLSNLGKPKKEKTVKDKKPINWRNILSIITAIVSLLFMIMGILRYLK